MTIEEKQALVGTIVDVNFKGQIVKGTVKGGLLSFPWIVIDQYLQFQVSWETLSRCILKNKPIIG